MKEFRGVPYWRTRKDTPGVTKPYWRSLMIVAYACSSQKWLCSNPALNVCDPVTYDTEPCEVRFGKVCPRPYSAGVLGEKVWTLRKISGSTMNTPTSCGCTSGCGLGVDLLNTYDTPASKSSRLLAGMVHLAWVSETGSWK